ILEEFEHGSSKLVRSGLYLNVDHAACATPVFGVVTIGEDRYFADRLNRWPDDIGRLVQEVDHIHVVVDAVQQEVVLAIRPDTVGRESASRLIASALLRGQDAG